MNWRRINNALHRDIGYFFFGMTIIYGLSGIALNHISDWDPNYQIDNRSVNVNPDMLTASMNAEQVAGLVQQLQIEKKIKKHYYPSPSTLKVFLQGGSLTLDIRSGSGWMESISRRPIFYEVNYLHYNHTKQLWTWFSDLYAAGLILLAITGLFVLRGKNGLRRRGVWFVVVGVLIPLVFLFLYL